MTGMLKNTNNVNTGVTEFITISKKEYDDLIDSQFWLDCLESAGVDNWEGYDYAREMYREGA